MQGVRWWNEDWDPVWKTMTDLGMALVFHEATGTYNATHSTDYKYDRYWIAHAMSHPLEMAAAVAGCLGYGVLERHPKLQALFCEAGATWVPYLLFRLDNHFEARRNEMTDISLPPSEYFKRQCVICSFEPEEALLGETMEFAGLDETEIKPLLVGKLRQKTREILRSAEAVHRSLREFLEPQLWARSRAIKARAEQQSLRCRLFLMGRALYRCRLVPRSVMRRVALRYLDALLAGR